MSKPQIAVRIPASLLEKLNDYVGRTGMSKTDVAIAALAQYLGCAEALPLSQRMSEVERRLAELEIEVVGQRQ